MNEDQRNEITDVLEIITEIRNMLRVSTYSDMRESLIRSIGSGAERAAYSLTDGQRTQSEIAKLVSVTQPSVSNWWKKWNKLGVSVDSKTFFGRQQKVYDLSMYEIK